MTHNQIELRRVKELERHNRSSEGLEQGRNVETARHNKSSEDITRQANDNQRRYWESTSAVNWFSARSNDAVNSAKIRDYDSQIRRRNQQNIDDAAVNRAIIQNYDSQIRRRNQQNVDDSARTASQIFSNREQAKYYKAKADEIPKESKRQNHYVNMYVQNMARKNLNLTKDYFLDIASFGMKMGVGNSKPTGNALSRLFKS